MAIAFEPVLLRSRSGFALRLVDALSSCLPSLSPSSPELTKKRADSGKLTLSCSKSEGILALNWRVARSLDLDQITAWQAELEV